MSNRFLTSGSGNLSDGTENIIGSNIGAANLLAGSTVKVNNLKQFVSTDLLISDVRGLSSALGSRLSNPSPVPIYAPSFVKDGGTSSEYLMADGTTTTGGGGGGGGTGSSGGWPASLLYTADMSPPIRPFSTFVSGDYVNFEARMYDLFGGESTFYSYTVRNSQSTIVYYKTGLIPSTVFNTSAETICNSINDTSGAEIGNNAYGRIWYQNNRFVLQLQSGPNVDERMDTYIYINSPQTMGINPQLWSFFDGTAPTDQTDLVVAVADYNLSSKFANEYQATWTPETDRYYTLTEVVSAMNATLTPVVVTNANTKSSPWLSTSNGNIVMLNTNFILRVTSTANLIMIVPGDYGTLTNSTDPNTYTALNSFPINLPTPVVGVVRWNNLYYPNATKIWVTNKDISNVDYYATLSQSPIGSIFRIQHRNDSSNYKRFTLTGATEINALYTTFNVAFLNTGGPTYFETGEPLLIVLEGGAGGGGGSGATGPTGPTGPSGTNGTNGTSFVYRGVWNDSTMYYRNESVTYNGLVYGDEYAGVYVLDSAFLQGLSPAQNAQWVKILPFGQQGNQGSQGVSGPTGPTGATGSFDKNTAGLFRWELFNPAIVVNNLTSITIPRQTNSVAVSSKVFSLANCGYIYSVTLPDISALGEGTGAVTGGNSFNVGMSYVSGILYIDSLGVQRMNIWKVSGETTHIAVGTAILAPAGATYRIYYDGTSANITIQQNALTQGVVGYSYTVTTPILFSIFTEDVVSMGFIGTQVSSPPVSITVNDISFVSAPTSGAIGPTGATGAQGPAGLSSSHFTYTFSDQVTGSPPSGHLFINNAIPDNANSVVVSHTIKGGDDIDFLLQNVAVNSTIIIQNSDDSNVFIRYKVLSLTSGVGFVTYGLEFLEKAGTIVNNREVLLIIQAGAGPVGPQGPPGEQGPAGTNGTNATNPNFTASVTSSGTDVTPAVTLTGTYPNLALGFDLRNGATGASGSYAGYRFNPIERWTTTITSGNKPYMYVVMHARPTVISGFQVYVSTGADSIRVGIYRGALRQGNSGNIVLCGQSTAGAATTTAQTGGLPNFLICRRAITAVSGQNLSFATGELMTIAFHSNGTTNGYFGSTVTTASLTDLAYTLNANYGTASFPSVIDQAAMSAGNTQKLCFELY